MLHLHFYKRGNQRSIKKLVSFILWHLFLLITIILKTIDACLTSIAGGERGWREGWWVEMWGTNCGCRPRICIASRRTAPSTLLRGLGPPDAPGVHRVPISMQPQAALFSLPPHRPSTSSGGTSWNALKIHCKPHEIDPGRSRDRVCGVYVCTECARIIVDFFYSNIGSD